MSVVVDYIEAADLPALSQLFQELAGRPTNMLKMHERFGWMQENPDYYVLAARVDGGLAGALLGIICHDLVGECRPFMVVENVIVAAQQRRRGVGKGLMCRIEEIAAERDCLYVMFVSSTARTEAHRFYESLGYAGDFVQGFKKYLGDSWR